MLVLFSTAPFIIHQYSYILFVILLSLLFDQKVKKNSAHMRFLNAKCSWHFLRGWHGSWILQGSVCLIAYAGHIDYIKTKKTAYRCLNRRAENEARTRDPNLGKVVLYQLSYFRIISICSSVSLSLAKVGTLVVLRQGCALPTELFPHCNLEFDFS